MLQGTDYSTEKPVSHKTVRDNMAGIFRGSKDKVLIPRNHFQHILEVEEAQQPY